MERLGYMAINQLSVNELERYIRQTMLPEIGVDGQKRLRASSALVVGAGGLGAPILYYLTAAGIGRLGIIDYDKVSLSNLQRQILFTESDLGSNKSERAYERLSSLNSKTAFDIYSSPLSQDNAEQVIALYDIVIDATDNLRTRYIIDSAAKALRKPYLYGAVDGFIGQCSLFHHQGAGAYQELFPEYDDQADNLPIGVVGATAGTLGSIMAIEAIKVLLGLQSSLAGTLLHFDLLHLDFTRIDLKK